MTVARILAEKGSDVATVPPHRTLGEAIQILAEKRIGALVICDAERRVNGILSERDVVHALAAEGVAAFDAPISRFMTTDVATCSRNDTIEELMEMMTEGRFRHVPVVEDGELAGIVSIGDVVKRRIATVESDFKAMRDYITLA